jgi:hypothetical protein
MMLIRINAPAGALVEVQTVPGLHIIRESVVTEGDGRWSAAAYASAAAVDFLKTAGCNVETLKSEERINEQLRALKQGMDVDLNESPPSPPKDV